MPNKPRHTKSADSDPGNSADPADGGAFVEPTPAEIVQAVLDEDGITAYELGQMCGFKNGYVYYLLRPARYKTDRDRSPEEIDIKVGTLRTILRVTGRTWGWLDTLTAVKYDRWKQNQILNRRMEKRAKGDDPDAAESPE